MANAGDPETASIPSMPYTQLTCNVLLEASDIPKSVTCPRAASVTSLFQAYLEGGRFKSRVLKTPELSNHTVQIGQRQTF